MKYPFSEQQNTACIVCRHFMEGKRPALFVSHDDDGWWQFLCGDDNFEEDARIISIFEAFTLDETIGKLADLPCGCFAERETKDSEWSAFRAEE